MEKTQKVLNMYQALLDGKEIELQEFCNEYGVSLSTFRRYMLEVRSFLWEKQSKVHYTKFIICQLVIRAKEQSEARKRSGDWEL